MTDEQKKEYYGVICDAWAFMKQKSDISLDDDYWKSVYDGGIAFYQQHGKTVFAKRVIMAVISELDEIAKEIEKYD